MAEWLCTGLQIRVDRFDSGLRLQMFKKSRFYQRLFFVFGRLVTLCCKLIAT